MKLVFFNRYYWPDRSATSQLLTDLATALAARGHEVLVVTGNRRADGIRLPPHEHDRGVEIRRLRGSALGRTRLPGRALDYLLFYLGALLFVLGRVRRGAVVVAKTDPPLLGAVLAPALQLKGVALVNWLQDLYPEVAERLGVLRPSLFTAFLRWLRNRSLRSARMNVVIGERMHERVAAIAGAKRVRTIHNWSPELRATPAPSPDNPYRRELGLHGEIVFAYSGNLGRAHRFDALLAAGERLRERRDLRFLIIGDGPQLPAVRDAAGGYANWTFLPPQPRERLDDLLGAADVHVVTLEPRLEGLIVPSKLYGVLAAGRPCLFIGAPDGEVAELLKHHDCGLTVAPDDVAGLEQVIGRLAADATARARLGANARRAAATFAFTVAARDWELAIAMPELSALPAP